MADAMVLPKKSTASERVAKELRRRIATGQYLAHCYLPPERILAEELGTSRTSVSAALSELARDRLVVQTRGRGTRVLPPQERLSAGLACIVYNAHETPAALTPEGQLILAGIQNTLNRLGYMYEHAALTSHFKLAAVPFERYGAFVCMGLIRTESDTELADLERRKVPLVVAGLEEEVGAELSGTWVDHHKTTVNAVQLLATLGHRRIAYFGRDTGRYFYPKAEQGYKDGLAAAGLPVDESLIFRCEYTPLASYIAAKALLARPDRPTGIVLARDGLAEGVCLATNETGLAIGRDLSVIGFDDLGWPIKEPFLTTFREPNYELGALAAEMLADRIVNGWRPAEKREIEAPLILRTSAGPAPGAKGALPVGPSVALGFR